MVLFVDDSMVGVAMSKGWTSPAELHTRLAYMKMLLLEVKCQEVSSFMKINLLSLYSEPP